MSASRSTIDFLTLLSAAATKRPVAYSCFLSAMRGKQYGLEETYDAWLWFLDGWDRAHLDMGKGQWPL